MALDHPVKVACLVKDGGNIFNLKGADPSPSARLPRILKRLPPEHSKSMKTPSSQNNLQNKNFSWDFHGREQLPP
jgi:hypothetical protein